MEMVWEDNERKFQLCTTAIFVWLCVEYTLNGYLQPTSVHTVFTSPKEVYRYNCIKTFVKTFTCVH